jgi:DNA-binding NarL/FixJ family response regulator
VKRVLLVDDHPIVRQGVRAVLAADSGFEICAEAESAAEALTQLEQCEPDLAIVDISLVGADGLELTKSIRTMNRTLPILIMSMHDESLYAERVLRAGANGYIMKQEVSEKIVEALRTVVRGDIYVSDEVRQRILLGIRTRTGDADTPPVERLSDRELEVFRLIGQGSGTRQIAEQLHLSVKTIETYRAHIKEKLCLDSAIELVRYAVQWVEQSGA